MKKNIFAALAPMLSIILLGVFVMLAVKGRLHKDWEVPLPGRYSIVSTSRSAVTVTDPQSRVIAGPHVDGYSVTGNLIIGHVSFGQLGRESTQGSVEGYFIVDTHTGKVHDGMDNAAWATTLKDLGVATTPHLRPVTRLDRLF